MKILSVSDVVKPRLLHHSDSDSFSDVDLVLSCGDIPTEYLSRLVHSFKAPIYQVRGNLDIRYDKKPPEDCRDLHGMLVKNRGINILGLEGHHQYNGGTYQYEEWQEKEAAFDARDRGICEGNRERSCTICIVVQETLAIVAMHVVHERSGIPYAMAMLATS